MLTLESVVAGYGETVVLRDVSIEVRHASVVALLGPNGAGKTTVMRVASGGLRPRHGRVLIDGHDVSRHEPHRRSGHGLCHIPEGRAVFPALSVRENLLLFEGRAGRGGEILERAVGAFPILGRRLAQPAGTLSGGEQQMLALARAYVTDPKVVLLDEVSMGLAPKVVDEIFAFVASLAASGVALLLVEQYVTRALELADDVYIMNRGRVAFSGQTTELDHEEVFARYLGAG